jgi:hypothetical protein
MAHGASKQAHLQWAATWMLFGDGAGLRVQVSPCNVLPTPASLSFKKREGPEGAFG